LESVLWVLLGGLIFTSAIVLARASRDWRLSLVKRKETTEEDETHEFAGIVSERNRPVPIFIWLVTIGYLIWAALYVVFSGTKGL
jgi:hypothetical protein